MMYFNLNVLLIYVGINGDWLVKKEEETLQTIFYHYTHKKKEKEKLNK